MPAMSFRLVTLPLPFRPFPLAESLSVPPQPSLVKPWWCRSRSTTGTPQPDSATAHLPIGLEFRRPAPPLSLVDYLLVEVGRIHSIEIGVMDRISSCPILDLARCLWCERRAPLRSREIFKNGK